MTAQTVDIVVVGAGPAGLSAGLYAARAGMQAVVLESLACGGQAAITDEIDNYPGLFSLSGYELGERFSDHMQKAGASLVYDACTSIERSLDGCFHLACESGQEFVASAVVYAAGAAPRPAGFEGEEGFKGHGVSYCATCDGMFYRNRDVYVVGGGTSACEEALFLARLCRSVTMVVRKDVLRTTPALRKRIAEAENITVLFNTRITSVAGEMLPNHIELEDTLSGSLRVLIFSESVGIFVFVGHDPQTDLVAHLVDVGPNGIECAADLSTSTPGLFVAGDVRNTPLRQVATAVSDGAVAATSALRYIESHS